MTDLFQNLISFSKQVYTGAKQIKNLRLSHLRKVFSLMGKREKIAVIVLLLLAFANLYLSVKNFYYNHSVAVPANGGEYSEGLVGQPTYINPVLARMEPDLSLTKLVFSGLYKYDGNGQLVPDLAEAQPQISEDLKQYTVTLKKNAKWQNGKPVTADDILFTIQTLQDPNFKSPLRVMWQTTTVEKVDDFTVKFTLKNASGPFIQNLTLPILPKAIWGKVNGQNFLLSETNLKAVGSGPYAIKEITKLTSGKVGQITLEAFGDFYGGAPKISTLTIKFYDSDQDAKNALHSGQIQGFGFVSLGGTVEPDKDRSDSQILKLPLPQYQAVFFNLSNKILSNGNVRQALSQAVDRREIINTVFNGQALLPTSPLLLSQGLSSNPLSAQPDITGANQLLDQDGWKIDAVTNLRTKSKQVLELNLITNDSSLNSQAADILAQQWRKLNIKINLTVVPSKQLTDQVIRPRQFDVLLFPEKFNADPDPFPFWHSSQIKDPGFNLTGLADPNLDKLINDARATTDQAARNEKYQQLDGIIASKNAVILLDQAVYIYALEPNIKNIGIKTLFDPSQRFYDINNWYTEQSREWK